MLAVWATQPLGGGAELILTRAAITMATMI